MSDGVALLLAVVLLLGNGFFVGAEFALISARRTQVEPRVREGSGAARLTLRAIEHLSLMLACAQLGITVCSLGLGAVAEPAIAHSIELPLHALGMPEGLLHPVAFALALTVVTAAHMVIGEMVPKNIALAGPERAALVLGPALYAVATVVRPFILVTNALANMFLRLLRVEPKDEVASAFTADEVASLAAESRREGLLDETAHELLAGALTLPDETARTVVLPMEEVVTAPERITPAELESLCAQTGYSRFPLEGDGGLLGYVHVKDVLDTPAEQRDRAVARAWVRPLARVAADDTLRDVLSAMQREGAHMATVVDGDPGGRGTVIGVAALEDVLERLVGEVVDAGQQTPEVHA